ncbi:hypothetical protein G4X40_01730 [Rhodococcus sp. D2-41]|uniref:type VII secretion target n=1 Tax=Speluncibacter jeojiensis TaxID=2710754 RepID=UPI00240F08DE|nr:type VII secretion target [Rhodococcus sp. D2-41]MDG3008864.1 hypothetical protein [Rhodococcus sp. D2-41]
MSDTSTTTGTLRADTAAMAAAADRIAGLSEHAEHAAAAVGDAAGFDLRPVFGCVGGEFVASCDAAQSRHREALISLAGLIRDVADTAHATAGAYADAERRAADELAALR